MTTTTSDQQIILPSSTDVNDVVTTMASAVQGSSNNGIESRLVKRYLSASDRVARNATPNEGELSYLADADRLDYYNGTSWVPINPAAVSVSAAALTAGSDTVAAAGYANMGGTGAQVTLAFTKISAATRVRLFLAATFS